MTLERKNRNSWHPILLVILGVRTNYWASVRIEDFLVIEECPRLGD